MDFRGAMRPMRSLSRTIAEPLITSEQGSLRFHHDMTLFSTRGQERPQLRMVMMHAETPDKQSATTSEPPPPPSSMEVVGEGEADTTTRGAAGSSSGIASGIRLEKISMTFKNQQVLVDCSWEVKKGERVGLVGVNGAGEIIHTLDPRMHLINLDPSIGAGKTTQLQIILGKLQPDAGEVVKAKKNLRIAYLAQEFDVKPTRTVREEFYSVYDEQVKVSSKNGSR